MDYEKKEAIDSKYDILRRLILPKLKGIRKQAFDSNTVEKFNLIFRIFLLRYLNLNYEFTTDELIQELERLKISSKLKERIIAISNRLINVEYGGGEISEEEFKSLANDTIQLVDLALEHAEGKVAEGKKLGIFPLLLQKFFGRIKLGKGLTKEEIKRLKEEKGKESAKSEKRKIEEERKLEKRLLIELRIKKKELMKKRRFLLKKLKRENEEKLRIIGKQLMEREKLKSRQNLKNAIKITETWQNKKNLIMEKSSIRQLSGYKEKLSDLRDGLQKKKEDILHANDKAREEIINLENGQKIRRLRRKSGKRSSGFPEILSSSKSRNKGN